MSAAANMNGLAVDKRLSISNKSPRSNVHKGQHKRLTQASRRPDHLAEEINLPERVEMGLEKLVPRAATSLWIGRKSFFPENVANRRFRDVSDAELPLLTNNPTESPAIFPGQSNHDFADLLKRDESAHLLIGLSRFFILNPTLPSAWVYNGDQPRAPGTDGESKFKQPFSLIVREEDFLLGDPRPKHFIFGLEKLNMSAQFVLSTPGQQKQQWRKPTGHRNIDSLEMAI